LTSVNLLFIVSTLIPYQPGRSLQSVSRNLFCALHRNSTFKQGSSLHSAVEIGTVCLHHIQSQTPFTWQLSAQLENYLLRLQLTAYQLPEESVIKQYDGVQPINFYERMSYIPSSIVPVTSNNH